MSRRNRIRRNWSAYEAPPRIVLRRGSGRLHPSGAYGKLYPPRIVRVFPLSTYVDPVNGHDGNDGLSLGTSVRTFDEIMWRMPQPMPHINITMIG